MPLGHEVVLGPMGANEPQTLKVTSLTLPVASSGPIVYEKRMRTAPSGGKANSVQSCSCGFQAAGCPTGMPRVGSGFVLLVAPAAAVEAVTNEPVLS